MSVLGVTSCAGIDAPKFPHTSASTNPEINTEITPKSSVIVSVAGLESLSGTIRATLSDKQTYNADTANFTANVKVTEPTAMLEFFDVPEGDYALRMFRDINENGKLDTNALGIPSEPYTFSNNARSAFGPPDFNSAKFSVAGSKTVISVILK